MPLDVEKYLPYFDTLDISHEDKIALIEWLFSVAEAFTDMAFGIHPTQMFSDNPKAFWESAIAAMQDDPGMEAE